MKNKSEKQDLEVSSVNGNKSTFLDNFEKILKLLASGAIVIAVMGIPAVYNQYIHYHVPSHFITYDQILKAGIFPTILLFTLGYYLYKTIQHQRNAGYKVKILLFENPLLGYLLFGPPIIAFAISFISWIFWYLITPLFWLINLFYNSSSLDLWRLMISTLLGFLFIAYSIIDSVKKEKKADESKSKQVNSKALKKGKSKLGEVVDEKALKQIRRAFLFLAVISIIFIPLSIITFKWYLSKIELSYIIPDYINVYNIAIWLGILMLLLSFIIFTRELMIIKAKTIHALVNSLNIMIIFVIFLLTTYFYSIELYPRLPNILGGGKLEKITIWIDKNDFPEDLLKNFQSKNGLDESMIRIDNILLLHIDTENIILVHQKNGVSVGSLIPRDKLKAISW